MSLKKDDVVSIEKRLSFVGASTFTVEEAADALANFVLAKANIATGVWTGNGVICRVLQVGGGGWKEGRVRISLEFIPDEEENEQQAELIEEVEEEESVTKQLSPLDEFRQRV